MAQAELILLHKAKLSKGIKVSSILSRWGLILNLGELKEKSLKVLIQKVIRR
jgi:hypothetical protein